jgi:signal transduction histidine kinase
VLNNLVGNAIDAMATSGGRLLVRTRTATNWQNGDKGLTLTVADTGEGMSAKVMGKIFDPFFTTKGMAGTGLGLWVSEDIVKRHGGALRVRSRRGNGTAFTLFLPFDGLNR